MSCLDNLVGVRGCGQTPATFNVNDLTGINVPDFDKALSAEQKAAIPALQDIISFATKYVDNTVSNYFGTKYELKTFIENDTIGYYYENKTLISATNNLTGYEIRIDQTPHLNLFINGLRLFVNHSGVVPVYVYDLIQGKLLDTVNVTAVAGEIVDVNGIDLSYATKKQRLHLFIGYNQSFEAYQTGLYSGYVGSAGECGEYRCGFAGGSSIYFSTKTLVSPYTSNGLASNTGGAGLSFNYSLQCSFIEYLCGARNLLAMPILYKCGELIMKELKHSKRLTGVVTCYAKNHDELMKEYRDEADAQLNDVLQNMVLPNSMCFSCTPKIRTNVVIP
jgi:hypothetical protein